MSAAAGERSARHRDNTETQNCDRDADRSGLDLLLITFVRNLPPDLTESAQVGVPRSAASRHPYERQQQQQEEEEEEEEGLRLDSRLESDTSPIPPN
ncbi:hypothetical protein KOW79_015191 [Hemibagrus wyckioides]|uniref:Uncharacterized protein n=1 Tax=Hemibagrus wyckioides TaxID=337641 RepID=A0A9D3NDJ5_9TELE|nr:hypothetical protein KOW79_015191 [Hemibagrus wyckioides]